MGFLRSLSQRFGRTRKRNPHRQAGTSGYREGFELSDMERRKQCECKVMLLDGSNINVVIQKNAIGQEVYQQVFYSLDIEEKDYFGLQFTDHYQVQHWLDPLKKLNKQVPIGPPYTFRFRVKFFTSEPNNLREELTRYQFFLQLKQDIQTGRLPCPRDIAVELAALALQSELGDYNPIEHTPLFVSEFRFHPEQDEDMEIAILERFTTYRGLSPAAAELNYLNKAKWIELYGVDMHTVEGKDGNFYKLGLTPTGTLVFDGMQKIGLFYWEKIQKLEFKSKKLTLVVEEDADQASGQIQLHTFVFNLSSHKACKHLWKCAIEYHTFFRLRFLPPKARRKTQFFRLGSTFRYRGRTEFENIHKDGGRLSRRQSATFERKPSQRYGPRLSLANRRIQLRNEIKEQFASKKSSSLLPDIATSADCSMQEKPKVNESRTALSTSDASSLGVRHSPVGSSMQESTLDKVTAASVRLDSLIFKEQDTLNGTNGILPTKVQQLDESPSVSRKAFFNDYKRSEELVPSNSIGSRKLNGAGISNDNWLSSAGHITTIAVGANGTTDTRATLSPMKTSADFPQIMPSANSGDNTAVLTPTTAVSVNIVSVEKEPLKPKTLMASFEPQSDFNEFISTPVCVERVEAKVTENDVCFNATDNTDNSDNKNVCDNDDDLMLHTESNSSTVSNELSTLPSRIPHLISSTQSYEAKKSLISDLSKACEKSQKSKLPILSSSSNIRSSTDASLSQERVSKSKIPKMAGNRPHQGIIHAQSGRTVQPSYTKFGYQSTQSRVTTDI